MKSLDKKKTKELDKAHEVLMSYIQTFADRPVLEIGVDFTNFDKLLTQQRTELLEEIKTRVDTWGGFEDDGGNLCHYDSEILEWVNDLLNKKDE